MTNALEGAAAQLAEVLAAENAALDALDLPGAAALLTRKTRAAEAFIAACAATPRAAPPDAARLAHLAEENRRKLHRAITIQGRVIELIARAVPRALRQAAPRYSTQGTVPISRVPAVAVSARA